MNAPPTDFMECSRVSDPCVCLCVCVHTKIPSYNRNNNMGMNAAQANGENASSVYDRLLSARLN